MFVKTLQKGKSGLRTIVVLNDDGDIVAWAKAGPNMGRWWIIKGINMCWTDEGAHDVSKVCRNNFGLPKFLEEYEDDPTTLLVKGYQRTKTYLQKFAEQGFET